jgi:hypothetical protein
MRALVALASNEYSRQPPSSACKGKGNTYTQTPNTMQHYIRNTTCFRLHLAGIVILVLVSHRRKRNHSHAQIKACMHTTVTRLTQETMHSTYKNMQSHYLSLGSPRPRSGPVASEAAPPRRQVVQAARAGLQLLSHPLSCCCINQSHPIPPVGRRSAWQGLRKASVALRARFRNQHRGK